MLGDIFKSMFFPLDLLKLRFFIQPAHSTSQELKKIKSNDCFYCLNTTFGFINISH